MLAFIREQRLLERLRYRHDNIDHGGFYWVFYGICLLEEDFLHCSNGNSPTRDAVLRLVAVKLREQGGKAENIPYYKYMYMYRILPGQAPDPCKS